MLEGTALPAEADMSWPAVMTPGRPWPLGIDFVGDGVNLAVFSAHAEAIELCLFDPSGTRELARRRLPASTDGVFHGHLAGVRPGQVYGLRAYGPYDPRHGHRFNPARLLLDPYARGLTGRFLWEGPNLVDPEDPWALDSRDSAPFVMKGVMLPGLMPGEGVDPRARLATPWSKSVLYEVHVRGMTRLHPDVPASERGRFAALAHPKVIAHLQRMNVTAVELLPVMAFLDERRLIEAGMSNYWGYNSQSFMALEGRYAAGDPLVEFKAMLAGLHEAGIEVILDVVYNHTAESDHLGPTLSFRGLDNLSYYRLQDDDPSLYVNDTGCGNTLNTAHPRVMQLVLDSLRYFALLGVDGFRFDLAAVLGRTRDGSFNLEAPLLQAIAQDPLLAGLKLIAEPWDIGPDGYQLGRFPAPFAEWNDHFRDSVRRFWRGEDGALPEIGHILMGSRGLFGVNRDTGARGVYASLNLITSHDGFTLFDTVAYAGKHNEANGEANRDGAGENYSSNNGIEGPTDDPAINNWRLRQIRNMLATLMLARGVPMLTMGDEAMRSQRGNNNAYCQDNEISWYLWTSDPATQELIDYVGRLARIRKRHPLLDSILRHEGARIGWFRLDGLPMASEDWRLPEGRAVVLVLSEGGKALFVVLNAGAERATLRLPRDLAAQGRLRLLLDTALESQIQLPVFAGERLTIAACSVQLYDVAPMQ